MSLDFIHQQHLPYGNSNSPFLFLCLLCVSLCFFFIIIISVKNWDVGSWVLVEMINGFRFVSIFIVSVMLNWDVGFLNFGGMKSISFPFKLVFWFILLTNNHGRLRSLSCCCSVSNNGLIKAGSSKKGVKVIIMKVLICQFKQWGYLSKLFFLFFVSISRGTKFRSFGFIFMGFNQTLCKWVLLNVMQLTYFLCVVVINRIMCQRFLTISVQTWSSMVLLLTWGCGIQLVNLHRSSYIFMYFVCSYHYILFLMCVYAWTWLCFLLYQGKRIIID